MSRESCQVLPWVLAVCLAACRAPVEVQIVGSETTPNVFRVSWASAVPGSSFVEYGLEGELELVTTPDGGGTEHEIAVLGLKAGETYGLRAVTLDADGGRLASAVHQVDVPPPPAEMGRLSLVTHAPDRVDGAPYLLTSLLQPTEKHSWVVVLDRDGDIVWWVATGEQRMAPAPRLSRDGRSVLFGEYDRSQSEDIAAIVRVPLDGSLATRTRIRHGHHDFLERVDGTMAWIAMETRTLVVDDLEVQVVSDAILEGPEGADDLVEPMEIFNFFDDYGREPLFPCECAEGQGYADGAMDWTHANSLMVDDEGEVYYLMSRNLGAIVAIERSSGELLWQMGGQDSDFTGEDPWSHAHMSHMWDQGMVVFDNGSPHEPDPTRVVEYAWDEDARTFAVVWEYVDPRGRLVPTLGDARKLPGGNYLGSWTSLGMLTEITPDHEVVWQVESVLGVGTGWISPIDTLYPSP